MTEIISRPSTAVADRYKIERRRGERSMGTASLAEFVLLATVLSGVLLGCGPTANQPTAPADGAGEATATYTVTFQATWSASTHPSSFPGNPHFSGLIGGTHNNAVIWQTGALASTGIKNMAELGAKTALQDEITELINAGTAGSVLSGGGITRSPGSIELTFEIHSDYPLVTLVSMLAPSPDWFVGVSGLSLRESGQWRDEVTAPLAVYDAGTDSGAIYTAANAATTPPEPIAALTSSPFDQQMVVGEFRFVRQ